MQECCSNSEKCCKKEECYHGHGQEKHEEFMKLLLETADCAWLEVLKDKIKEHILATQNERMAELAKIVAEANNQRWKSKMEKKRACKEFHEKLHHVFSGK